MSPKIDQRMLWLRLTDTEASALSEPVDVLEAELASEASIVGEVELANGTIWMRPLSFMGPDSKGLLKYALRVAMRRTQAPTSDGTRDGYIFPGGVIAELAALMSLALQARVFVLSTTMRSVGEHGDRPLSKDDGPGLAQRATPWIDAVVFDRRERSFTSVPPLLDQLKRVPGQHHLAIAVAAGRYAQALRMIGLDEELVFINLVSAIERLCGDQQVADEPLSGLSVEDVVRPDLGATQIDEVRKLFKHRGSQKRFAAFLETYATGFFDSEKREPEQTQVTPENLKSVAKAIYDARSKYLHNGDPMYLSPRLPQFPDWHMDPSGGRVQGDRRFARSQKLPRADFFHRLVRHCILQRIPTVPATVTRSAESRA